MQPLNHDMDELMRKAAADYPVKPQGADWQKVAQQLQTPSPEPVTKKGYGGLKKLLLIFPFLLAAFVCDRYFPYQRGVFEKHTAAKVPQANTNGEGSKTKAPGSSVTRPVLQPAASATEMVGKQLTFMPHDKRGQTGGDITAAPSTKGLPKSMGVLKSSENYGPANVEWKRRYAPGADYLATAPVLQKVHVVTVPYNGINNTPKKSTTEKNNPRLKKLYLTLLAGPDISRVKGQRLEAPGYSVGVLFGYRFAKHWLVESGLYWDRKNYYSKGDYFKTDKIYLPYNSKILEVEGYCDMFEIPVNARFYAVQKPRSALVVSAGLSSYLMQKEDYTYAYERYNTVYSSTKYYRKASKDWFSIANISVAYEQRLGRSTFRLEPYIKRPLRGVGIGALPLSSAGVLVGLTHPIR